MAIPTVISAELVDCHLASGSPSITVPTDCTLVVAGWGFWDNNSGNDITSLAINGSSFTLDLNIAQTSGDLSGCGAATLKNPSTGTQTLSYVNGEAISEGGGIVLVYVKGEAATAYVQDTDYDRATGYTALSSTVTSTTTDLVLAFCQRFFEPLHDPIVIDGTAIITPAEVEGVSDGRQYYATKSNGSATSTTITADNEAFYGSLVTISIKEAGSGIATSGAVTLPSLTVSGAASVEYQSSGAVTLPLITIAGDSATTYPSSGGITLPSLTVSGLAQVTYSAIGAVTLPMVTVSGEASQGSAEAADTWFNDTWWRSPWWGGNWWPSATLTSATDGAVTLPLITVNGAASVEYSSAGAVSLPAITTTGAASVEYPSTGAVSLPSITATGAASITYSASGAVTLPMITVSGYASGVPWSPSAGAVTLPGLNVSGNALISYPSLGGVTLPMLSVSGQALNLTPVSTSGAITLPRLTVSGGVTVDQGHTLAPIKRTAQTRKENRTVITTKGIL